jgi:hypothetical protein
MYFWRKYETSCMVRALATIRTPMRTYIAVLPSV